MCNTTCAPIDLKVYLYNPKQPKWAKPKPADHPQLVWQIFNQTTFVCIALVVWGCFGHIFILLQQTKMDSTLCFVVFQASLHQLYLSAPCLFPPFDVSTISPLFEASCIFIFVAQLKIGAFLNFSHHFASYFAAPNVSNPQRKGLASER